MPLPKKLCRRMWIFCGLELMTHLEHYRSSEGYQIKFAQFYDTRYSLILYNNTVVL